MNPPNPFREFIRRIRAGDHGAAEELVRDYEPLVRREIRLNMSDRRMARLFDSVDVCQSLWSSFFLRAAAGQYELESPEHLARLLLTMAQNKLASQARHHHSQKRDIGRMDADDIALETFSDKQPSPSSCVSAKELRDRLQENLSDEERQVSEMRMEGLSWEQIAESLGGTPDARRMQMTRAADRVTRLFGIEE